MRGNMKTMIGAVGLVVFLASVPPLPAQDTGGETYSSVDRKQHAKSNEIFPAGLLRFTDADLAQVLDIYRDLSYRTIIRATSLPSVKINLQSQTPLTRLETLQALDTVLAQNGIVMIPQGAK